MCFRAGLSATFKFLSRSFGFFDALHCSTEVRFSEFRADYVVRNTTLKSEYQLGKSQEPRQPRVMNSVWLPRLSGLSERCALHCLLASLLDFSEYFALTTCIVLCFYMQTIGLCASICRYGITIVMTIIDVSILLPCLNSCQ